MSSTYATLQEVKDAASIQDAIDDSVLTIALESAARAIDAYCQRRFYTAGTETRVYVPDTAYLTRVEDIAGTAIAVAIASAPGVYGTTLAASVLQMEPLNRLSEGMAWPVTRIRAVNGGAFPVSYDGQATVQVTAEFGFGTAVPEVVREATILQTSRLFSRRSSPQGVAGFGDMGVVRVSKLDPDIQGLLSYLRRTPVASA